MGGEPIPSFGEARGEERGKEKTWRPNHHTFVSDLRLAFCMEKTNGRGNPEK